MPGTATGDQLPGFPVKLSSPGAAGAEIVTSPAIAAARRRSGPPEVIVATNEVVPGDPQPPGSIFDIFNAFIGSSHRLEPGLCGARRRQHGRRLAGPGRGAGRRPAAAGASRATTPRSWTWTATATTRSPSRRRPRSPARGRSSSTATARRSAPIEGAAANCPDQGAGGQPRRLPVHRRPLRRRHARRRQGRAHPERRREPPRREPEPPLLPRRAGLEPGHGRRRCPATRAPPTTSSSSRRPRSPAWPEAGRSARRWWAPGCTSFTPTAPPGPRRRAGRSSPAAGSSRRPAVGDADGDGKLDVAALTREGWSFLWRTRRPGLRRLQQRVVDLPPRRAQHRQLRRRRAPAGLPEDLAATRNARWVGDAELEAAGRRLALRRAGPLPGDRLEPPIDHPTTARIAGGAASGRWRSVTATARPGKIGNARTSRCSTATRPATGAS